MIENTPSDRKSCSYCGHSNRASAKICTECGRSFTLVRATGVLRKRCPECGYENRLRAKVCSQCGHTFQVQKAPMRPVSSTKAKWCPKCGSKRRPNAKVCSQCGYRFEVDKASPTAPPIVQMPQPAITQKPAQPPPVKLPPDLKGEPAPYITDEELNKLRQGTSYHSNVFVRMLYQMTKKDDT
ncbi:MAG: zinc-ribbon domain-containing protein [Anaerolineaceae bacterium]|nr:zinc-ribbon domain-containing protein [Anaerolineaceae bacterium]